MNESKQIYADEEGRIYFNAGSLGKQYIFPSFAEINTVNSEYTLQKKDSNGFIRVNSGSSTTINVPNDNQAGFSEGVAILITQIGSGSVILSANNNVTINSSGTTLDNRYNGITLVKVGKNEWDAYGNLS